MKIAEYSIERPVATTMFVLALMVFGFVAYMSIGLDYFPDVDIPNVTIMTRYEGASPESVESDVTEKIEEAVSTISGIKKITSTSYEGLSMVVIEFELTEKIDVASQDVRDKVAKIRQDLPLTIEEPIIEKLDLTATPVLYLALSGDDSTTNLTLYADEVVKRRLESVSGVGRIDIYGGRERTINIWLQGDKLKKYGLVPGDVMSAVQQDNVEPPGGRVETIQNEIIVKTLGKMETIADFEKMIVKVVNGSPVLLSDVARIEDGGKEARSYAEWNGRNAVSLTVQRQGGKNTVQVANNVMKRVAEMQNDKSMPKSYKLEVADDLSKFIKTSV
ncbi:MAG: efflux RND transporter permease subunit, partial [Planctomycetaceae bacterium]|nr:efflux RND transporter permease subunit [Planctomycetaceae bacterium]